MVIFLVIEYNKLPDDTNLSHTTHNTWQIMLLYSNLYKVPSNTNTSFIAFELYYSFLLYDKQASLPYNISYIEDSRPPCSLNPSKLIISAIGVYSMWDSTIQSLWGPCKLVYIFLYSHDIYSLLICVNESTTLGKKIRI